MPPEQGVIEAAGLRLSYQESALRSVQDQANGKVYRSQSGSPWPSLCFHALDHQDWLFTGPEIGRESFIPASSQWMRCGPLRWTHRSMGRLGLYQVTLDTSLGEKPRELRVDVRLEGHWDIPPLTGFISLLGEIDAGGNLTVDTPFAVERRDPEHDIYMGDVPQDRDLGLVEMFERLRPGVFWGRSWCDWSGDGCGITLTSVDGCTYWYKEPQAFGHLLLRCVELKPGTWEAFCPTSLTGSGIHTFSYIFRFHDGDWRTVDPQRRSLELRHPPVVVRADSPCQASLPTDSHSFLSLDGSALLSAYYHSEDGIYLRFYEHQGMGGEVSLQFDWSPQSVQAVDLLGQPADLPVALSGKEVRLNARPWQIVTLRLER
jgi:hypothetical protein